MSFTKSEISKMTFEELKKVKLHVSKEQNKFPQENERWINAETLRLCIETREDELEKQFIKDAKARGAKFLRCSSCSKDKPLEDHPYGFMFRLGKKNTICKRCQRNHTKNHHSNNLEMGRARATRNQSQRQGNGEFDYSERALVRQLQKDTCAYCGGDLNGGGEWDHFKPVEHGGSNTVENRVLACTTCNRNKGRKMPDEFFQWRMVLKLPIRQGGFYEPHKRNHHAPL